MLYAAGAGVLLLVLVLATKKKASAEPAKLVSEEAAPGAGTSGAAGEQLGSELGAFRSELADQAKAIEEASHAESEINQQGFTELSRALTNVESELEKSNANTAAGVATAERLATVEGQYHKAEAEKAKLAAGKPAHKTAAKPAAKTVAAHHAPAPHKHTAASKPKTPAPKAPGHKPTPKPAAKAAPKPKPAVKHKKK